MTSQQGEILDITRELSTESLSSDFVKELIKKIKKGDVQALEYLDKKLSDEKVEKLKTELFDL